ncbi:MAG: hypothetical protein B6I38_03765 [Anaerolineaceae bacterium 4572_5.1]|nr:MAG: hypothetical protein B6I38_03765 [Anaerolineaceae bacterium 4572_5.1]
MASEPYLIIASVRVKRNRIAGVIILAMEDTKSLCLKNAAIAILRMAQCHTAFLQKNKELGVNHDCYDKETF